MTTILYAKTDDGRYFICGKTCYDAKGSNCGCICDGANHGVGLKSALRNNTKHPELILELVAKRFPAGGTLELTMIPPPSIAKPIDPKQGDLPCQTFKSTSVGQTKVLHLDPALAFLLVSTTSPPSLELPPSVM